MSFAYIFVHRKTANHSYKIVKTDNIINFDIDKYVCANKQRLGVAYSFKNDDGSIDTCQVLAIAGMFHLI